MSNNLPENNKPEEVDLGVIFTSIEKLFKKIGDLITKIVKIIIWVLNKLLIFFLFSLNIIRQHFIKFIVAGVLGFGLIFLLEKSEKPQYVSNIIIKQNYETGRVLYDVINNYNSLAESKDSISLSKVLGIDVSIASKLTGFNIVHRANRNKLLEEYYRFVETDSNLQISYQNFLDQKNLEDFAIQNVSVRSLNPSIYDSLAPRILSAITDNKYFSELQNKDTALINNKINDIERILKDSDTLQKNYLDLLKNYYGQSDEKKETSSTINLNLSNSGKDRINTKEFDLFQEQSKLLEDLTLLKDELRTKSNIIELQKDFDLPIRKESNYKGKAILLSILLMLLVLIYYIYVNLGFKDFIKTYGSKDRLLKK
ncbi:hypothetical protein [Lacinutrix salivirga]